MSTVITICYFLVKLCIWLADSFHAIPDKTKRPQVTAASDRDQDTQTTTKGSQSDTESQSTDSGHQTITTDNGLRVRTEKRWPETDYITEPSRNTRGVQEPAILLPGKWPHNVLNTTEHYPRSQGLPTSAEHLGWLCETRSGSTKSNSDRTSDNRHESVSLTIAGTLLLLLVLTQKKTM